VLGVGDSSRLGLGRGEMNVGDKVKLTIPSDLAYGEAGHPVRSRARH